MFSGIGGLDLAAEWAGFKTVGQCEWAEYPRKVLEKHWPEVPRWKDIRTLTESDFYEKTGLRTVDVISGGFPCQPFSVAGKRRGEEDDRYLWPEMLRVIEEIKPTWVVGENVFGIVNMALDTVLSDLEAIGYEAGAYVFPALAVGAWHRRDRVAIVANSNSMRLQKHDVTIGVRKKEQHTGRNEKEDGCLSDCYNGSGLVRRNRELPENEKITRGWSDNGGRKKENGERSGDIPESRLGGMADGLPNWVDEYWGREPEGIPKITNNKDKNAKERIKCLGNAVVPMQFYPVFKAIAEAEKGE